MTLTHHHPVRSLTKRIKDWLNEPTPRKQMLPAYLILGVGAFLGLARFEELSTQRAADAEAFAAELTYTQCVSRVETRDSLRGVLFGIAGLFPTSDDVNQVLRLIESDYPHLEVDTFCAPYKLRR